MRPSLQTQDLPRDLPLGLPQCWPGEAPARIVAGRIIVTAYRGAEEPQRLDRVARVAEALVRKGSPRLRALHDHKGTLHAGYYRRPTLVELDRLKAVWRGENEAVVGCVCVSNKFVLPKRRPQRATADIGLTV